MLSSTIIPLVHLMISSSMLAACSTGLPMHKYLNVGAHIQEIRTLPEGKIGVATSDNHFQLWDTFSGKQLSNTAVPPGSISWDGSSVISNTLSVYANTSVYVRSSAYPNSNVYVVEIPSGEIEYAFPLNEKKWHFGRIGISESGHLLAWVQNEESVKSYPKHLNYRVTAVDLRIGKQVARVSAPLFTPCCQKMEAIAISPDETKVAVGSPQGDVGVGVIDLKSQKLLWQKRPPDTIWDIAFTPDGKTFFTTDQVGKIIRYDTATGKTLSKWTIKYRDLSILGITTSFDQVLAIDVSPDGKYVAAGTAYNQQVFIWDIVTGKIIKRFEFSSPIESALTWTRDSSGVWAAGTLDKRITFIPVQNME